MSRTANMLYNLALEQRKGYYLRYHKTRPAINYQYQNAQLVELKESFPEFKRLYSLTAQEVLRQVHKNYNSYWGRLKKQRENSNDPTARPPKYRSGKRFFTLSYVQSGFSLDGEALVLSGGNHRREKIKISGYTFLPEKIHSLTVSHDAKNDIFHANLVYEYKPAIPEKEAPLKVIAFDPGVKTFLTGATDDGRLIEIHSSVNQVSKYFDKQIDRVKSLRDRCKKGSRLWKKRNDVLRELYRRRNAQVKNELHSTSKLLAENEWDIISIGNPEKQGMLSKDPQKKSGNQKINRAVQNNWPLKKFLGYLDYKAEKRGNYAHRADERYSTQTCSKCAHRQKLDPSVRVYRCPKCGLVMGRDENAAVNLLNKILAELARPPVESEDFTACVVYHRTPWGKWYTETSRVHNMALAPGA
jgi:putative transposase